MNKIAGYLVRAGHRSFGLFDTADDALEWINGNGLNWSGPQTIEVIFVIPGAAIDPRSPGQVTWLT